MRCMESDENHHHLPVGLRGILAFNLQGLPVETLVFHAVLLPKFPFNICKLCIAMVSSLRINYIAYCILLHFWHCT